MHRHGQAEHHTIAFRSAQVGSHVNDEAIPESLFRQLPVGWQMQHAAFIKNAGGFSGARLWRLSGTPDGCLRRWPLGSSGARIRAIHQSLKKLAQTGIDFVPTPYEWRDGATVRFVDHHWWELTRWLPGASVDDRRPTYHRMVAAMQGLARVHLVWDDEEIDRTARPIPAIHRRWRLAEQASGQLDIMSRRVETLPGGLPWIAARMMDNVRRQLPGILPKLAAARSWVVPLQLCIRDVRRNHLLFVGDQLTGIVDFDATGRDSVCSDISRLLADWDIDVRDEALESYAATRPVSALERQLTHLLHQANPVLSGLQWLQWLLVEGRPFDDWDSVSQRMLDCLASMTS